MTQQLYTPKQVANTLQVCRATILRWLTSGKLPGYKLGYKLWRVKEEDLENFIMQRRNK